MRQTAEVALRKDQAVPETDSIDRVEEFKPQLMLLELGQDLSPEVMLKVGGCVAGFLPDYRFAKASVVKGHSVRNILFKLLTLFLFETCDHFLPFGGMQVAFDVLLSRLASVLLLIH